MRAISALLALPLALISTLAVGQPADARGDLQSPDVLLRVQDGSAAGNDVGRIRDFLAQYRAAGVPCEAVDVPVRRLRILCRAGGRQILYEGYFDEYGDLTLDKGVINGRRVSWPVLADLVVQIAANAGAN